VLTADVSNVANTPIMAMTVRSSIRVNPHGLAAFFAKTFKIYGAPCTGILSTPYHPAGTQRPRVISPSAASNSIP
jgi:hypothetical protein